MGYGYEKAAEWACQDPRGFVSQQTAGLSEHWELLTPEQESSGTYWPPIALLGFWAARDGMTTFVRFSWRRGARNRFRFHWVQDKQKMVLAMLGTLFPRAWLNLFLLYLVLVAAFLGPQPLK